MERMYSRSTCKPFGIILAYFLITQLSAVTIFMFMGIEILQRSKSTMDPHVGNITHVLTKILSGLFTSMVIFKFGRRRIKLFSGVGVGIICLCLGIYMHHEQNYNIVPQICYVAYIIFSTIGHYTLPVLIMFELYPLQIRGLLGGISMSNICFLVFAVNICYPHVCDLLGFSNTITSFIVCSLLGCIYLYFCLPEGKCLTLQDIERYYEDLRPAQTSQRKIIPTQNYGRNSPRVSLRTDRKNGYSQN